MSELVRKLESANMDFDLATPQDSILWHQDKCPWNQAEHTQEH